MATLSAYSASPPPPSRIPAGSRASSRHASIAPRTTSAHGPLAWAAPRTRTHRSIPAPPTQAGASRLPRTVPYAWDGTPREVAVWWTLKKGPRAVCRMFTHVFGHELRLDGIPKGTKRVLRMSVVLNDRGPKVARP